jgi:acyl carrier protein
MTDRAQTATAVSEVILTSWPQRFAVEQLNERIPLGEGGLGLDSIELAELILGCEERCGGRASEALFTAGSLTIGLLADHFSARS